VLGHLDVLRADAGLLSNFLHGLAAAGAESVVLAEAARGLWPSVVRHALGYANDEKNPYKDRHWGNWSADALLPEPLTWSQGMYNECIGAPIDWVRAEDFLGLIDDWLSIARGERKCVDGLIGLLRRLPLEVQVRRGLAWVSDLCIQNGTVTVYQSWNTKTGLGKFEARPRNSSFWMSGRCWSTSWSSPGTKGSHHTAGKACLHRTDEASLRVARPSATFAVDPGSDTQDVTVLGHSGRCDVAPLRRSPPSACVEVASRCRIRSTGRSLRLG
jgi:hypothetical protein